ncbi:hypothetical protein [Microbacterium sp. 69-10]|nr:hypothetical protein [Microbacterium sp. 69-10]
MEINPALVVTLTTLPVLIGVLAVALNAKRLNAAWRERREARSAAKAASQ